MSKYGGTVLKSSLSNDAQRERIRCGAAISSVPDEAAASLAHRWMMGT
jgi:hypothetical protein